MCQVCNFSSPNDSYTAYSFHRCTDIVIHEDKVPRKIHYCYIPLELVVKRSKDRKITFDEAVIQLRLEGFDIRDRKVKKEKDNGK